MANDEPPGSADYEVGFKKPPTWTQFQKGVSGNMRGRPKGPGGSSQLYDLVLRVFGELVPVKDGSMISAAEGMIKGLAVSSFKGGPAVKTAVELVNEAMQTEAALNDELFAAVLQYKRGWDAARRRGDIATFDSLLVNPDDLEIDRDRAEVRWMQTKADGRRKPRRFDIRRLLRLINNEPPPQVCAGDETPLEDVAAQLIALQAEALVAVKKEGAGSEPQSCVPTRRRCRSSRRSARHRFGAPGW